MNCQDVIRNVLLRSLKSCVSKTKMAKTCSLFPHNPDYCTTIVVVKRLVAALSIVGCLFIIFIIWLFKKYKYFVQRLILALSIAAFLDSVAYMMGELHPEEGTVCTFQAWWLSFFEFSMLIWVTCITFNLYRNAIKKVRTEQFEKWYHLCSWGIALVMSCLPFINNHYGPAGAWCWIKEDSPHSAYWRFMTWYVPLFVIVIALYVVYGYIFCVYRRQAKAWAGMYNAEEERNRALLMENVKPLMAYPCIYLLTSIFPLIHRIYNASSSTPNFPLLLLHVISNPIVGALNAIVFGLDKETFNRLNLPQMRVALAQHSRARKPLVREYPVGDTTEVRPNDDSSWSSSSTDVGQAVLTPTPQGADLPSDKADSPQAYASNIETNEED